MKNLILGINTVVDPIEICLVNEDKDFAVNMIWPKNKHESKEVLNNIDEFIKEHNFDIADIDKVLVVNGKGGYTGTRIGVSIANMFAFVQGVKLYSVLNEDLNNETLMAYISGLDFSNLDEAKIVYPKYSMPARVNN